RGDRGHRRTRAADLSALLEQAAAGCRPARGGPVGTQHRPRSGRGVALVQAMLTQGGFADDDLECPPDWPLGELARDEWIASGGGRTRVRMNCSGKHAAMMLTCQANGWPVDGYPAAAHPLQRHLAEAVGRLADERVAGVGVDGCGAPVFAITLLGLARACLQLVTTRHGPAADV